jgi:hypothetical protein
VLTFPDRGRGLESVDHIASGLEAFGPVGGRYGHEHRDLAEVETADAVVSDDPPDVGPPTTSLLDDVIENGHDLVLIGLIGQRRDVVTSLGVVTNGSGEHDHGTTSRHDRPIVSGGDLKGVGGERKPAITGVGWFHDSAW